MIQDNRTGALGGPMQHAVLALLALEPNPPANAMPTEQAYVSVGPADVDWVPFERLLQHARGARAAADLSAADAMLIEANALWRLSERQP